MKWQIFTTAMLIILLYVPKQIEGNSNPMNDLIDSMRNSFSSLSSKRDLWYKNYSQIKKLQNLDKSNLEELLLLKKIAYPMLWQLYSTEVKIQKRNLAILVKEEGGIIHLPYHVTFPAPHPYYFHVEITLQIEEKSDFQVEILRDETSKIFILRLSYEERRLVLSDHNEDGEVSDHIVLEGDHFPAISPREPFRINVQIADDCSFTSFWIGDLSLDTPMALPTKHYWCTKVYHTGNSFSVNVLKTPPHSSEESEESEETAADDVEILSATVYESLLVQ